MRSQAAPLTVTGDARGKTLGAFRLGGLRGLVRPASGLLLAVAAALLVARFAAAEHETLAITEGRFLALEIGLVLAAVGWLGRSFLPQLAAGATVLAALALPALPTRAAAVEALLVLFWLLAVAPLLDRERPSPADYYFAALGLQALSRPDLLLGPYSLRSAALVLMPALAALALHFLAERFGGERSLAALAVVALLSPGLNVNATLLLLAAAAGAYAGDPERWLPARGAAAALLLLPLLTRWPVGLLATGAGLVLLGERIAPRRLFLPAAAVLGAGLGLAAGRPVGSPRDAVLVALALAPAALLELNERWRLILAGLLLALTAPFLSADAEAWAAGALLLVLALPIGPSAGGGRIYLGLLLAGALLLAGFPWLRAEPLLEGARLLGGGPARGLVAALFLVALPAFLARRFAGRLPLLVALPAVVVGGAFLALALWRLPPAGRDLLGGQPQSLVATRPNLRLPIEPMPSRQLVIDSSLFHGAELEPGQTVASIGFYGPDGVLLLALPLRAGDDTADWAAGREDARRRPDFRAPRPWLSQVAPDGSFFSGRFRRVYELPRPVAATAVELQRDPGLPAATQVALYGLELRP